MTESIRYIQKKQESRLGLQAFFLNLENNSYDCVSNKLIEALEKKLTKLESQVNLDTKVSTFKKQIEIQFLKKELFVILEMKIIYAYKHFEIHLKFLLKASYQEIKENKLFKWEIVEDFLKSKKINPKEISSYEELRDLRNLNNVIKHARNILDNKTKNITEFHNITELKYTDLLKFYNRIEYSSLDFLKSLSIEIDKNLYEFTDERLENISENLSTRMDRKTINKLIKKLKNNQQKS